MSKRQAQLAQRLGQGYSREQIASELGIAVETVRTHARGMFQKLEVRNRLGMVVVLVTTGRRLFEGSGHTTPPSEPVG